MRTSNPALRTTTFSHARGFVADDAARMTVQGTATKSMGLALIAVAAAAYVWAKGAAYAGSPEQMAQAVSPWMFGGMIGGLITGLIIVFRPTAAPWLASLYGLLEGFFLGGISAIFEVRYPGIVMPAVGLTFGTLFAMLIAYKSGLIRVTDKFRMGVVAATGGIFALYMISFLLRLFGIPTPLLHSSGLLGIGISVVIVVVAALNLALDFDLIEQGARRGAPKYMEWYGAFALLVTLVWLYLEILRLLSKLRDRR
jgi:uncharacterized YccA/Bax inhibitor family protein